MKKYTFLLAVVLFLGMANIGSANDSSKVAVTPFEAFRMDVAMDNLKNKDFFSSQGLQIWNEKIAQFFTEDYEDIAFFFKFAVNVTSTNNDQIVSAYYNVWADAAILTLWEKDERGLKLFDLYIVDGEFISGDMDTRETNMVSGALLDNNGEILKHYREYFVNSIITISELISKPLNMVSLYKDREELAHIYNLKSRLTYRRVLNAKAIADTESRNRVFSTVKMLRTASKTNDAGQIQKVYPNSDPSTFELLKAFPAELSQTISATFVSSGIKSRKIIIFNNSFAIPTTNMIAVLADDPKDSILIIYDLTSLLTKQ